MRIKGFITGIAFVLLMVLSTIYLTMAAAQDITITVISPANNSAINGTFEFSATVIDTLDDITKVEFFYKNESIPWMNFLTNTTVLSPGTYNYSTALDTTILANGTYQLNVTVTDDNSTNNTKSDTSTFFVVANAPPTAAQESFNFSITADADSKTTKPNINATYTLTINHTGDNETDIIELEVTNENAAAIASLSETSITLSKGVPVNVFLNVTNESEGSFKVTVNATSAGNPAIAKSISTTTNVVSPFNVSLTVVPPSTKIVPPGVNGTYTLTLTNIGEQTDSYNLTIENNPIQAVLSQSNITNLANGSSIDISLNVSSPTDGTFIVNVTATSINNPNKTASVLTTTEVKTIHDLVLDVTPAHRQVSLKENATFTIEITNTGNVNDNFTITTNDTRAILSKENTGSLQPSEKGTLSMNFSSSTSGNFTIRINATSQENSSIFKTQDVTIFVPPKFFFKGNRIWDGGRPDEFSTTYTWNPMSFSGFYYDFRDNVGSEEITITLGNHNDRNIDRDDLTYTTKPEEVSFGYSNFGKYEVIGFMAEKYFAGYTGNTTVANTRPRTNFDGISVLSQGQLHKVLIDDDTQRTVSVGSTLTLKEGYVLKAKDIDMGARTMLISLLKDGDEVDSTPLSAGETYVYTKRVGSVSDLPLIIARFDNVFSGQEIQAAFLKGMFQISESATTVKNGNRFGRMEVTSVDKDKIEMKNKDTISLSEGRTEDVMGDIKIVVAGNSSVVRFALSVEKTGKFEVRSTVYREDDTVDIWTPYNFGMNIGKTSIGFYYDLDDGIGSESLKLDEPLTSRTIKDGKLIYTTKPEEVSFGYSNFGKYQVIGFMAEKYFAGYTGNTDIADTRPRTNFAGKSVLSQGQLHKVLIDDDTQRTISVGGTLTLKEGYVLKAKDIDMGARTMLISLLKDGGEVDSTPLSAGETYVYTKRVGSVSDLPLIMVRFESVFSGQEIQAAFLRGMFQISESATTIKGGDKFDRMEVSNVNENEIEMSNYGSISLDKGRTENLMGNIKLKVADSDTLRFYFAVDVSPEMVANQLIIDAPAKATAGDAIKIKVTAGGNVVEGASISIDPVIGQIADKTDSDGVLNYTLPRTMKGTYNITADMLGYLKTSKSIEVLEYIELRLSIDAPAKADQFETITIRVMHNGTPVSGATVAYDNVTIGTTDSEGTLNYKLETSGTHTISASKDGYITVSRDIEVRMPFSEYKALDINVTPDVVFTNQEVVIRSNITNTGTKADTLPVDLIINNTVVDTMSVTLAPGDIKEINFTRKAKRLISSEEDTLPGNYTIEILGQKGLVEVKEEPTNYLLIGIIATGLGVIIIYILTAKNMIDLETIRSNMNMETIRRKLNLDAVKELLVRSGKKGA
ncbi:S-layer-related duplication domain [Candidatus Methanoperedens nitroreducens]|uniref:S-layer-related duplication domain n=1 Tax=Candidatus Methanoperedens nitratireducens TaxID=1392998 RepID=A0A062UZU2_9EURY|nr:S-layer protein domain-containing protein [Candidatus Methanoperedens nitroreducens]KCZ70687.1 S-layer-related duplication domain [Candidatus Methanoperedens nitroreducens]MDJ1420541.1 S-layer protein domain-containing protein [Candidatus Methanoperedens sp.]